MIDALTFLAIAAAGVLFMANRPGGLGKGVLGVIAVSLLVLLLSGGV